MFISALNHHFWQYAVMCRVSSQILIKMNEKKYDLDFYQAHVEQRRKSAQVIRWLNVELPSLNGQKVR